MRRRSLPLADVYRHLEPGPVVLLTTARAGRANVMAMSWHTMLEFEPPLVGCVVSNRNFSYATLVATKECVLAIPTAEIARRAIACGNVHGRRGDKFATVGLTPVPASRVRAPLVDECYANFECRVVDTRMVRKYGFFVVEVVQAWADPRVRDPRTIHHRGRGVFMFAGERRRLPSRAR